MAMKLRPATRLRFEDELTDRLRPPAKFSTHIKPAYVLVICIAASMALGLGASHFVTIPAWNANRSSLEHACRVVIEALKTDSPNDILPVCAEGERGLTSLGKDNERVSNPLSGALSASKTASCVPLLAAIRANLSAQDMNWDQLRPLAFGGIEATVADPAAMPTTAVCILGELYFSVGNNVYALELSARRCGKTYLITDLWKCAPLDTTAQILKTYSTERFRPRLDEFAASGDSAVESARYIYWPLPE